MFLQFSIIRSHGFHHSYDNYDDCYHLYEYVVKDHDFTQSIEVRRPPLDNPFFRESERVIVPLVKACLKFYSTKDHLSSNMCKILRAISKREILSVDKVLKCCKKHRVFDGYDVQLKGLV